MHLISAVLKYIHQVEWTPEKAMASHSSSPAWRIPGTGEPGGLPSVGLHRVGHDWSNLAAAAAVAAEWTPHGQNKRYEGLKNKVMYI